MSIAAGFLPEFDMEMANTRKMLERIPDEKMDWRPHPKSYTLGELASHLGNQLTWTGSTMESDSLNMSPENPPPPQPKIATRKEALALFDENLAAARAAIDGATDERLLDTWSLVSADESGM